MKSNQPSRTAWGVAFLRALEQTHPPATRLVQDRYARVMLTGLPGERLARQTWMRQLLERLDPSLTSYIAIRDRFADEWLDAGAQAGVQQLLVLGAGFDTISFRALDRGHEIAIYEVDHPATMPTVLAQKARIEAPADARIHRVTMDFETDSLIERVLESGFKRELRTITVLIGVSYYLTIEVLQETLSAVADLSAAGSLLVLDFWPRRGGPIESGAQANWLGRLKRRWFDAQGETVRLLMDAAELPALLEPHGFEVIETAAVNDLIKRFSKTRALGARQAFLTVARRG